MDIKEGQTNTMVKEGQTNTMAKEGQTNTIAKKKKEKRTNNDLQNIHIKLKIQRHEPN
jgi:hypothetical protein